MVLCYGSRRKFIQYLVSRCLRKYRINYIFLLRHLKFIRTLLSIDIWYIYFGGNENIWENYLLMSFVFWEFSFSCYASITNPKLFVYSFIVNWLHGYTFCGRNIESWKHNKIILRYFVCLFKDSIIKTFLSAIGWPGTMSWCFHIQHLI